MHGNSRGAAFAEAGYSVDAHGEAVFEEALGYAAHHCAESVHPAVELVIARVVHKVEAQPEVPGKGVLDAGKGIELPAAVA